MKQLLIYVGASEDAEHHAAQALEHATVSVPHIGMGHAKAAEKEHSEVATKYINGGFSYE